MNRRWFRRLYLQIRYSAILAFIVGVLLGWGFEYITGRLEAQAGWRGTLSVFGLLIALIVCVILIAAVQEQWKMKRASNDVGTPPSPRRGLILLLSNVKTARSAIDYHRDHLEVVWFVVTKKSITLLDDLHGDLAHIDFDTKPIQDEWRPAETANAIQSAMLDARVQGLALSDLVCDITGGTKPMSIGAFYACRAFHIEVEVTPGIYGSDLKPDAPITPIALRVDEMDDFLLT
ncbi:MAG: hypothetical protein H6642_15230 [Caldilineaceae bacterium]|nr:hypothetical protein [Caldilineaceae bacterium]